MTDPLPEGAPPRLHDIGRWISRRPLRLFFRVRVHHVDRVPRTGPVVIVANHSSMADGPILFGSFPRRVVFLIKQEMFKGVAGTGLRAIGQLAVRRGEPDRKPLLAAQKVLRAGGVIGVFPEGTRGTGDVNEAQQGAAWLARSSGALVVPVACRGTLRPTGTRRRFRPVVDVLVGEAFELPADKGRQALVKATEQVRDRLATLVAELDSQRGEVR
ncbi:lysophospholipid acyltransferase family protein [Saccharothrix longispora]|uniref:lysophospholipid acyltransferase family protein n=1 Tax=Saccharothrix longispora TaxID=33920 RepID=UPI0028FD73AC|nr:lysophospholipid acyltransferase family protein [Saccharothrix longispora]MBY8851538.1 1-acyl-sn-glycerol-3-phosphate acyltransferase [Saccharothrix sp. MB29]MDU0289379.1 lysophospholipid acyltransferase family protein [Saccharothrix longispora]